MFLYIFTTIYFILQHQLLSTLHASTCYNISCYIPTSNAACNRYIPFNISGDVTTSAAINIIYIAMYFHRSTAIETIDISFNDNLDIFVGAFINSLTINNNFPLSTIMLLPEQVIVCPLIVIRFILIFSCCSQNFLKITALTIA